MPERAGAPESRIGGPAGPALFSDADAIARAIIERTEGDIRLGLPLGLGKANTIVNALTRAALEDRSIRLTIFTALTLERPSPSSELEKRFLEPAMDRLFGAYPPLLYAERLRSGELPENIEVAEFFLLAGRWLGVEKVQQNYISANYTHAFDYLLAKKPNLVTQLLARDDDGALSLACNTDITADLLWARAEGDADFLFVGEINNELPFMGGSGAVAAGDVDLLLDDETGGFELFSVVKQPVDFTDYAIGLHVSRLVEDGGSLQIGIGSIGDAVARALILRDGANARYDEIIRASPFPAGEAFTETAPFEEGLYGITEMLVDGLLQLFEAGIIRREVDGAAIHAGFFVESRDFYRRLREMPAARRGKIAMMPVSFTNQLYGGEAEKRAARKKARFVNSAMMATVLGAVVSDATGDGQVVSGVGGQFNFVAQAFALKDARSIITLPATRTSNGKTVSNIVWSYPHQTVPRHYRDIIVTEYGIADLRGKSDAETIAAMLAIADSRFQPGLMEQAKEAGKLPGDYAIPGAHRENTPARVAAWLAPNRRELLPAYPFGTDFTDTEQRLIPALSVLKQRAGSITELALMALRGFSAGQAAPQERAALERMGLAEPKGLTERLYASLIRAALAETASDD